MTWRPLPDDDRRRDPRRIGDSLDRLLPSVARLMAAWPDVVGAGVADHAQPVFLRATTLVVEVHEPIWRTQLAYLEPELVRRFEEVAGAGVVTAIEVRIRPPKRP